jgi:hypothetical protein
MVCPHIQCAEGMSEPSRLSVTLKGKIFEPVFRVRSISPTFVGDLHKAWHKSIALRVCVYVYEILRVIHYVSLICVFPYS